MFINILGYVVLSLFIIFYVVLSIKIDKLKKQNIENICKITEEFYKTLDRTRSINDEIINMHKSNKEDSK